MMVVIMMMMTAMTIMMIVVNGFSDNCENEDHGALRAGVPPRCLPGAFWRDSSVLGWFLMSTIVR